MFSFIESRKPTRGEVSLRRNKGQLVAAMVAILGLGSATVMSGCDSGDRKGKPGGKDEDSSSEDGDSSSQESGEDEETESGEKGKGKKKDKKEKGEKGEGESSSEDEGGKKTSEEEDEKSESDSETKESDTSTSSSSTKEEDDSSSTSAETGSKSTTEDGSDSTSGDDKLIDCKSIKATGVNKGDVLPNLVGKDENGKTISLYDLCNSAILLEVSTGWCGPCKKAAPHLQQLYTKYKERGFEVVTVLAQGFSHGSKTSAKDITEWKKRFKLTHKVLMPVSHDAKQILNTFWNDSRGFPSSKLMAPGLKINVAPAHEKVTTSAIESVLPK